MSNKIKYFVLVKTTSLKSDLQRLRSDEYDLILLIQEKKLGALNEGRKAVFAQIRPVAEFDLEHLTREIEAVLGDRRGHDEIRFITNDESSLCLAGQLRERFQTGEAPFATMNRFKDKGVMKRVLQSGDPTLRIPRYMAFDPAKYSHDASKYIKEIENTLCYPIFAKPVDNASSCFTRFIRDRHELSSWLSENGVNSNFELDEYINGDLYHCDSLVENGTILFAQVSRYNVPCADFLKGSPLGSITLNNQSAEARSIQSFNEKVLRALAPLPTGAFHLEVFRIVTGGLVFLEIAARTPGAYVPQGFLKAFGLSLEEAHLRLQMGIAREEDWKPTKDGFSAWMWYPLRSGVVAKLVPPKISSEFEIDWKVKVGDVMTDPAELSNFAVGIKLWNKDFAQLSQDFEYLRQHSPAILQRNFR